MCLTAAINNVYLVTSNTNFYRHTHAVIFDRQNMVLGRKT